MRHRLPLTPFFLLLAMVSPALAQTDDDVFAQLSELRLDRGEIYRIRGITVRRDVLSISFNRGVIAFLEPVAGHVTGAVFVGSGEVLAIPPDEIERRQLFKFTQSPILNERFNAAILRFTDDTHEEIFELIQDRAHEEVRADDLDSLLPWESNLGENSRLLNFRLLTGLLGTGERPFFFATFRGDQVGWFDVGYDEGQVEEVVIGASGTGPDANRQDVWASFNKRDEARDPERFREETKSVVDVLSYDIETTILEDASLEATTTVTLRSKVAGEQVLSFDLTPTLRLSEVTLEGEAIAFHQHPVPREVDSSRNLDALVVVLPRPTRKDEELTLNFRYAGRMLERRGEGVFYVSERAAWYPRVRVQDGALYALSFRYPSRHTLVATGEKLEEVEVDGFAQSRWTSGREFFRAGFNYGDFSIESDESGRIPIYVYANKDVEAVYKEIEVWRAAAAEETLRAMLEAPGLRRRRGRSIVDPGSVRVLPDFEVFSTQRVARNILREVRATLEFFSGQFGGYPFERLSVSQFPVLFSQGWPSLLYTSTLSFFDQEQRERLGFVDNEFVSAEFLRAHEIAHQWFGNKVGWTGYRDQWISEGFSNYAGLMYLEHKYGNAAQRDQVLDDLVDRLLRPLGDNLTHDDNGPIWLGSRLATAERSDGYVETIYPKSTWVVHMLRMLMRDEPSSSDERFIEMLNSFLGDFEGRPASTWDLKRTAERFISERMDVSGDGTLDWFFDQWVFGTGVPGYGLRYDVTETEGGFTVSGHISQEEVSDFVMPVPVYAVVTGGRTEYLGDVIVSGEGEDFSFSLGNRPLEILVDPFDTILKRS